MSSMSSLQPYFYGITDKIRVIIYLLATGQYSFDEVRTMTVGQFKKIAKTIPVELMLVDVCDSLIDDRDKEARVFLFSKDRGYSEKDLKAILLRAHNIAGVDYTGLKAFVKRVNK